MQAARDRRAGAATSGQHVFVYESAERGGVLDCAGGCDEGEWVSEFCTGESSAVCGEEKICEKGGRGGGDGVC